MLHHVENHINRMREKPHHIKKQYSFFVSLAITLVIFGFWATSMRVQAQLPDRMPVTAKAPSPISSLTASAGDAFTYVKEFLFGANKATYSSDNVEVVGGRN